MDNSSRIFVGIDVGGTFTDLIMFDSEQLISRTIKVPSSPPDFYPSVVTAMKDAECADVADVSIFHGTTVHLNAFLERKGAKTALVTTEGFGDVYEMRRGNRENPYDIHFQYPDPLVPRQHIMEVSERMLASGEVLESVDPDEVGKLAERLRDSEHASVAICLLNSYKNPENERQIADTLSKALPDVFVSPSSDICREWREYERTSTACINAYVSPVLKNYLSNLEQALTEIDELNLFLLQSNGGLISAAEAKDKGVLTLLSGPVGGNVACRALSKLYENNSVERKNLICIDMGGTSFEASLIIDGKSVTRHQREVGGFPILSPMVDIHTIGAGGGSIAWNDEGALKVGPHSAGADPGPACYGLGGKEATVTDANMVLGRLGHEIDFGSNIQLNKDYANAALDRFATDFDLGREQAAQGILDVINEQMANAIRTITVRRGIDPRDFTLVAYGGAGPMHAAEIAGLLGMKEIIVPRSAGTFSAWGMLQSDLIHDRAESMSTKLSDMQWDAYLEKFQALESETHDILKHEGVPDHEIEFIRALDLRYEGQEYSLTIEIDSAVIDAAKDRNEVEKYLHDKFDHEYKETYGHSNPTETVEISGIRLRAIGHNQLDLDTFARATMAAREDEARSASADVIFDGEPISTPFVSRGYFDDHGTIQGPVVIVEKTCTTVVPPGFQAEVDPLGNILLSREGV